MKKILASVLSMLAVSTACSVSAFAEDSVNVYVTIADAEGKLALAAESVTVTDTDGDGALTINDALYAAHEVHYEGGAAAGYASAYGDYGLSMTKLWGAENGSGFGYYINNAAAWSLEDPIAEEDCINAFVYTDLTNWSDTYCYFDAIAVETLAGIDVTLTLSANSYDADWNPIVVPVEGAVITLDGEATEWTTDAEGKVTMRFEEYGSFVISAVSDTQILVPPACLLEVTDEITDPAETTETTETTAAETTTTAGETTTAETTTTAASTTTTTGGSGAASSPKTGDSAGVFAIGAAALTCFGALALTRRRNDAE